MAAPVSVRAASTVFALALALSTSCTGDCGRAAPGAGARGTAGGDAGTVDVAGASGMWGSRARPPARLAGLPAARVVWRATLPGTPGLALIEHSAGPVLVPASGEDAAMVVLASSAIGFVAVDADTGAVRWQRRGEDAPEQPLAAEGGHLWLPGRCAAHPVTARGAAAAPMNDAPVLGCVEVVNRAGGLVRRAWLHLEGRDDGQAVAVRGRRGRALGRVGARLLWSYGPEVLAFDSGQEWQVEVYRAGEGIVGDVFGWLGSESGSGSASESESASESALASGSASASVLAPGELIIATSDALMGFDASAPSSTRQPPRWHLRVARSVGVAGPVRAAGALAWVRDNELQAVHPTGASPAIAWTADEYHSYAPGSLIALDRDRLLALSMAGGIHPVIRDAVTGRLLQRGQAAPGIQVLAAVSTADSLAAVVRLDRSLRRDAVIAWDADLRIAWAWPLPAPPRPRITPVGLAASGRDALVFYDGRHAIRLSPP